MDLQLDLQSFHYPGGSELFGPFSLALAAGQTVALVGGSGSGKSTLLTLLAGLHPTPLGGRFQGRLSTAPTLAAGEGGIGYLASDPELFSTGFCATVVEEVGWSLFGWGWTPQQVEHQVMEALAELGLEELAWRDPRLLSGGEQQMVALAAVWARRPLYLLLDEPASRLDPQARLRLQTVVARLAGERQVGVVWATPNLAEVTWCDLVWSLELAPPVGDDSQPYEVHVQPAPLWTPEAAGGLILPWPLEWANRLGTPSRHWTAPMAGLPAKLPSVLPAASRAEGHAIEVDGLVYGPAPSGARLLEALDWRVERGECTALVGVNGAGKTTLARLLRGLLRPQGGTLRVAGTDVASRSVAALTGTCAYTFQEPANLFMRTRVDAELRYSGHLLGLDPAEASRRAEQALELFELGGFAGAHPRELPASVASLLGVALSWFSNAPVQILDEPLARLDGHGRTVLQQVISGWRGSGTTVLVIAHDLDWLSTVCSSFSVLDGGKIVAQGSATKVFADPLVQARLGAPIPLLGQDPRPS